MRWKFFESGVKSAKKNMEQDASLLENLKKCGEAILHFYDWEQESLTYGHFISPEKCLNLEGVKAENLEMAKRPTGGGIVFHNCDFAFSVLVPATHPQFSTQPLDNYAFINSKVKRAIERWKGESLSFLEEEESPLDSACSHFCMAKPTKYDIMLNGKKVGGAAQRMTKVGYLHQGSILLGALPTSFLENVLKAETMVAYGMQTKSFPLLGSNWTKQELIQSRLELKSHLAAVFSEDL